MVDESQDAWPPLLHACDIRVGSRGLGDIFLLQVTLTNMAMPHRLQLVSTSVSDTHIFNSAAGTERGVPGTDPSTAASFLGNWKAMFVLCPPNLVSRNRSPRQSLQTHRRSESSKGYAHSSIRPSNSACTCSASLWPSLYLSAHLEIFPRFKIN